jgi:hypothetical protein
MTQDTRNDNGVDQKSVLYWKNENHFQRAIWGVNRLMGGLYP